MSWADLAPVIARYGIELAYELWKLAAAGGQPTDADWQSLIALARKPMEEYLTEARARAGLAVPAQVEPTQPPPAA